MNLYYMKVSLRCWAAHPHILALLNVFSKMSRVVNKMYALSYAFKWGGVPENVALECSQTRPASPIKKKKTVLHAVHLVRWRCEEMSTSEHRGNITDMTLDLMDDHLLI